MGYTLIVDPSTPLLAMHRALRQAYSAIANDRRDATAALEAEAEQEKVYQTIGLAKLLEIEARAVER